MLFQLVVFTSPIGVAKGCSAFPSAEKAQRHQERWAEIRRQHREERLEQADEAQEEVTGDEKANV